MQHEKIIKRKDGSEIKITVAFKLGYVNNGFKYDVWPPVMKKPNEDIWKFANTSVLTPEEILAAKLELWEKMKPQM